MTDKLDGLSMDIAAAEQDKLRAVFPQCFVEGKLDVDKLLALWLNILLLKPSLLINVLIIPPTKVMSNSPFGIRVLR